MTKKNYEKIAKVLNQHYLFLLTISPPPLFTFSLLVDNFIEMLVDDYKGAYDFNRDKFDHDFNKDKFREAVYKKQQNDTPARKIY